MSITRRYSAIALQSKGSELHKAVLHVVWMLRCYKLYFSLSTHIKKSNIYGSGVQGGQRFGSFLAIH